MRPSSTGAPQRQGVGRRRSLGVWLRGGAPGVWLSAGAVAIAVLMTLGLIGIIAVRGLAHFWPAEVVQARYTPPGLEARLVLGQVVEQETIPAERLRSAWIALPPDIRELDGAMSTLCQCGS